MDGRGRGSEGGAKEGCRDGGGFVCWDKASKQRLVGECKEGRRGEGRAVVMQIYQYHFFRLYIPYT